MTFLDDYDTLVARGDIENDRKQRDILSNFERLSEQLSNSARSWLRPFSTATIPGVYLHGPVGCGKTFMMDFFFDHLKTKYKERFHFHHFMQHVDLRLRELQGEKDPLKKIAKELSKRCRVLCLDEFLVQDIAHAMILAQLLEQLFAHHVTMVTTSNTLPDNLYLNGLQRVRFLPAIALIKAHCNVVSISEHRDYRLGRTSALKAYLYPLNQMTKNLMVQQFEKISPDYKKGGELNIQNRLIPCVKQSEHAVWFDFDILCNIPRSQLDYLEIAEKYQTVFVSNLPQFSMTSTVKALLFMLFIDVMYDHHARVILSSEVPTDELYEQGSLRESFQRTISRLREMQSLDYLKRIV